MCHQSQLSPGTPGTVEATSVKMPSAGRWQRGELVSVMCWKNIWEKMEKPVALQAMPGEGVGRSQDSYGGSTVPSLPSGVGTNTWSLCSSSGLPSHGYTLQLHQRGLKISHLTSHPPKRRCGSTCPSPFLDPSSSSVECDHTTSSMDMLQTQCEDSHQSTNWDEERCPFLR